ncbi:MAG: hypothetical protein IJW24_02185 [Clostridia bacterium]|nr:hypothetical protein [Clostridia bacterium]
MGFQYNISNNSNDTKPRTCMLACHMIATIVNLFVNTFLVAYIYDKNASVYDYIFNVSIYNISAYAAMAIFYIPLSYIVDKTNRVGMFRVGLIMRSALVILVIFCGEKIAKLTWLAGIVNGASDATYFASYNVLKQEMVSRKKMSNYSSTTYIISKLIEVVCPIALGALIDVSTFSSVAFIVLIICAAQVGMSFGIKSEKTINSCFNLRSYFKKIKQNNEVFSKLKIIYLICAIYGSSALVTMLINICIMIEYGSSFSLGAITSAISICAIITLLLVNKFSKPGNRSGVYIVCGILVILSSIILLFDFSQITIVVFNLITACTGIIYKVEFDIYRNGVLKEAGLYSEISEHHTVVEVLANISRVIFFAVLLLISLLQSMLAFKIFIIVTAIFLSLILILIMIFENKFIRCPAIRPESIVIETSSEMNK